ncbi:MAG: hypothetical protein CSB46_08715 [Micrococcales bacterium]|nr:MAG: hypothetical protein CSB46_08715 [Micrococcales bacterium]
MVSDEVWAVIAPLLAAVARTGQPPVDRRTVMQRCTVHLVAGGRGRTRCALITGGTGQAG